MGPKAAHRDADHGGTDGEPDERTKTTLTFQAVWVEQLRRFVSECPPALGYQSPQEVLKDAMRDFYRKVGWDPVRGFAPAEAWRDPMAAPGKPRE